MKEAKQICPDVVVVLGEDLTRFRNASKVLYAFLSRFSWSNKAERLGFDEVSDWLRIRGENNRSAFALQPGGVAAQPQIHSLSRYKDSS